MFVNVSKVVAGSTSSISWNHLSLPDADIRIARFCDAPTAATQFASLREEIPWERHRLRIFGRDIDSPRLSCWIGDAESVYTYSKTRFVPRPWTPMLATIRDELPRWIPVRFNSVLCNLYRDGNDSMGWHSDSEPELGSDPIIASLSFGATRTFRLRHRTDPSRRLSIDLESGSLLVMAGATQRNYRHDLPRAKRVTEPRINLTFRRILTR